MRAILPAIALLLLSACGSGPDSTSAGSETEQASEASAAPVAPTTAMGEQVYKRCVACHTIEAGGANGIGPNLHGVAGRAVASISGFNYSDAMKAKGGLWDEAALDAYLTSPMKAVPGNRMAFAGIADEADRKALILYLQAQK